MCFCYIIIVTVRKRSLGQGNIFTPVCHSVHRGGLPNCMLGYLPLRQQTPQEQTPPGPGTPPRRRPPWDQAPPREQTPPGAKHAGRYGQRAGSKNPTGMQSCTGICLCRIETKLLCQELIQGLKMYANCTMDRVKVLSFRFTKMTEVCL